MDGIFDSHIAELSKAPHLLTKANLDTLRDLIPASPEALTDASNLIEMGKVLQKLIRVAERLYTDALMSSSEDSSGDLKAAANALKQAMDVAIRYTDKINASDRAIKVENALVAALNEFAEDQRTPELVTKFNRKLKEMLE